MLDIATSAFSTIGTASAGVSGDKKYAGAAAVGTNVYFAPSGMGNVGMLDTTTSTFTTIDTEAAGISGYSSSASRYDGAVALGGKVYFAPSNQDGIGVVDAASVDDRRST